MDERVLEGYKAEVEKRVAIDSTHPRDSPFDKSSSINGIIYRGEHVLKVCLKPPYRDLRNDFEVGKSLEEEGFPVPHYEVYVGEADAVRPFFVMERFFPTDTPIKTKESLDEELEKLRREVNAAGYKVTDEIKHNHAILSRSSRNVGSQEIILFDFELWR